MIDWNVLSAEQQREALKRPVQAYSAVTTERVAGIIQRVQQEGDAALYALSNQFDAHPIAQLVVPQEQLAQAKHELAEPVIAAIDTAYRNICCFHQAQQPQTVSVTTQPGVQCELRHAAIERVGLYVPGGTAPLPSTMLMLGVPAQIAGCQTTVACTPPDASGGVCASIRYAAALCGIDYLVVSGGAQAVAAMAFGTETVPKVDKIYGPGNSYVTEAKQQVSTVPGGAAIDMPAGPSEVLVIADEQAEPEFNAADLLSQAEHGADSQAVIVCHDRQVLAQSQSAVTQQLARLSRQDMATKAISNSRFILSDSLEQSIAISNQYAPEHLIVNVIDTDVVLPKLTNAGSIFVGAYTPESVGDYASGTNHVLPTYGYTRSYSSLSLVDFYRRYTVQTVTAQGLQGLAPAVMDLAEEEGLDAHSYAVAVRLQQLQEGSGE